MKIALHLPFISGETEHLAAKKSPRQRRRRTVRETLRRRMSEYRGGFTVHGLNWLCTGSLPEKIVWSLSILLVVGFAIYMINGYVGRYLMYEWRTEIRYEEMSSIVQPVIVICSASLSFLAP